MSYILEALKKSEKERQRGTLPDLLSSQDAMAQEPKKRSLWPYLILIALLLNAGLFGWWLVHWQSKKQPVVAQSTVGQQRDSKGVEPFPSSQEGSALKSEHAVPKLSEQHQPVQAKTDLQRKAQDNQMPTIDTRGLSVGSSTVPYQTPIVSHVPSDSKPGNKSMSPVENKVYDLNELPIPIQQSLPAFAISVFLYSEDPTSRMVKINGQMMREGQYLTAGLKLEEITSEGVILSYKNYRFRIGLK
ncbi:MAG: general secretion pathway protein GspB [Nitrospirota bacterium]|nr:general secretion pathway protein GspB [Nitrospirota bacterium]MDH5767508.1 general secretion pathway protein GspB [Nitrospirota bacterium]